MAREKGLDLMLHLPMEPLEDIRLSILAPGIDDHDVARCADPSVE